MPSKKPEQWPQTRLSLTPSTALAGPAAVRGLVAVCISLLHFRLRLRRPPRGALSPRSLLLSAHRVTSEKYSFKGGATKGSAKRSLKKRLLYRIAQNVFVHVYLFRAQQPQPVLLPKFQSPRAHSSHVFSPWSLGALLTSPVH